MSQGLVINFVDRSPVCAASNEAIDLTGDTEEDHRPVCTITQDRISWENMATLECGHQYDKAAIMAWLGVKRSCPTCRAPVRVVYWQTAADPNTPETEAAPARSEATNPSE